MKYNGFFKEILENEPEVIQCDIYEGYFAGFYDKFTKWSNYDIDYYIKEAFLMKSNNDNKILELACGTGRITIPLLSKGFKVVGIDLSKDMLQLLEESVKTKFKRFRKNLTTRQMNILELDYEDEFDMIFLPATTICLLEDDEFQTLLEVTFKALKKNGRFLFDYELEDAREGTVEQPQQCLNLSKDEKVIFQEFKDYDNSEIIVNFYAEVKQKDRTHKYLASTRKRIILRENIDNLVRNSSFQWEDYKSDNLCGCGEREIVLNILKK